MQEYVSYMRLLAPLYTAMSDSKHGMINIEHVTMYNDKSCATMGLTPAICQNSWSRMLPTFREHLHLYKAHLLSTVDGSDSKFDAGGHHLCQTERVPSCRLVGCLRVSNTDLKVYLATVKGGRVLVSNIGPIKEIQL